MLDFDKYLSSWLPKIQKKVADNITKSSPLLYMMLKKKKKWDSGGDTLQPPIKYKHAQNRGSFRGYDTLDITPQDTRTAAEFKLKQVYASIVFNDYEKAADSGQLAVQKVVQIAYDDAMDTLKDLMSEMLFADGTGNEGKDITGISAAVDNGSNTAVYGGIDRSTNPWWRSQYDTGSVLSVSIMREIFTRCSRGGMKNKPDYIVTDLDTWNAYAELIDGKVNIQQPLGKIGQEFANLGFVQLSFMGVPVVYDEYCPENTMYFLNSDTIALHNKPGWDFRTTEIVKPANMMAKIGQLVWYGENVSTEPRANGRIEGLTYAS